MRRNPLYCSAVLISLALAALTAPSEAQTTYTWINNANGTGGWNTSTNWDSNGVPVAASDSTIQIFAGSTGTDNTVAGSFSASHNLGNSFDLGALTLRGTASSSQTFTISGNSLDFTGTANTISLSMGGSLNYAISSNINFSNGLTFTGGPSSANPGLTISGALTGSGGIIKNGAGRVTLSSSSNSFSGGLTVNAGRLLAGANDAFGTGALNLNGGIITYVGASPNGSRNMGNSSVVIGGSVQFIDSTNIQGNNVTFAFSAATVNLGNNSSYVLTIDNSNSFSNTANAVSFSGVLSNGSLIKSGKGTLILTNANSTYTGDTIVRQGTLRIGNNALSGVNGALGNSTSAVLLGGASTNASANITLENSGSFTVGRNIDVGNQNTGGVTWIRGSGASGTNAVYSGNISLERDVLLGTSNTGATTEFSGEITDGAGSAAVRIVGNSATSSTTGGVVILSSANSYDGGTTVESLATLSVTNTSGSATGTGGVTVNAGGTITGNGSITGSLALSGTISPGNSPGLLATGSQTWTTGANYLWQLADATGEAGTGYDTLDITGTLNLGTLDSFTLNLQTLSGSDPDVLGNAANFNSAQTQAWVLASTSAGITGFDAADFTIDASQFANDTGSGVFSVEQRGNDLVLVYTVPEPGVAGLLGLGVLLWLTRSRNRNQVLPSTRKHI